MLQPTGEQVLTDGMTDQIAPTADYYRETAAQIRAFAQEARLPEVRGELYELAERFERMARYVEQRYPHRRGNLSANGGPDDA